MFRKLLKAYLYAGATLKERPFPIRNQNNLIRKSFTNNLIETIEIIIQTLKIWYQIHQKTVEYRHRIYNRTFLRSKIGQSQSKERKLVTLLAPTSQNMELGTLRHHFHTPILNFHFNLIFLLLLVPGNLQTFPRPTA